MQNGLLLASYNCIVGTLHYANILCPTNLKNKPKLLAEIKTPLTFSITAKTFEILVTNQT